MDKTGVMKVILQVGARLIPAGDVIASELPKLVGALTKREVDSDGNEPTKDATVKRILAAAEEGEKAANEQIHKTEEQLAKDKADLEALGDKTKTSTEPAGTGTGGGE